MNGAKICVNSVLKDLMDELLQLFVFRTIFHSEFSANFFFLSFFFFFFFKESGSPESRVNAIHFLVHKLPEKNKEMLDILVKHLTK